MRSLTSSSARALAALTALACALAAAAAQPASARSEPAAEPSFALSAAPAPPAPGSAPTWAQVDEVADAEVVPGSLVVTTAGLTEGALLAGLPAAVRGSLASPVAEPLAGGIVRLRVEPGAAALVSAALAQLPGVLAVEPEREWSFSAVPDDPDLGRQWAHELGDSRGAWDVTSGTSAAVIAIVDSGIDGRHPDLAGRLRAQEVVGVDAGGNLGIRSGALDNDACKAGHGTMVAGVAGAIGDNGTGVAGVAWNASLVDIAVASRESCAPTDAKVVAALGRIASGAHGRVDVVNLSLGGVEPSGRCPAALQSAIDQVIARGTVVVAAAGNAPTLDVNVPAACRGVVAVGAGDRAGGPASYSAMARYIDLSAPGGDSGGGGCDASSCILTTWRDGAYGEVQGTSFAAPYVSGVVALLRSVRTDVSPAQVEALLELTARHPAGPGAHDHRQGWGRVQAGAALRHLRDGLAVPAPREHPVVRIAPGGGTTAPISQAVAMSRAAFDAGGAHHAVIARDDDFADALAGSSLAHGMGPLLFARPVGGLPPETAAELRRTLGPGRTVYLLGGTAALDARLEADISALGLTPLRLQGKTREHTAVAVARALRTSLDRLGITPNPVAIVATRGNWPDAVAAGSLGAAFGVPILLTAASTLHPATRDYLDELGRQSAPLRGVYVVGGTAVVSDATAGAASAAARTAVARLSGATRDQTALAVAREMRRHLAPVVPPYAITVDLDRADSYAHVLSASALAGSTFSVFLPVRGPSAGQRLTDATVREFCGSQADGLLAGDVDLLPVALGDEVRDVLGGTSARCR